MKKLFTVLIWFIAQACIAQYNLVPNPSFEQYTTCPNFYGQITRAVGWNIPLYFSSADYLNACDSLPNNNVGVPYNSYGYEPAHTGNAYVAFYTYFVQNNIQRNYREYIQTQLTDSLLAGVSYCISFYVSACDSSNYVSNNIGMYFSSTQVNDSCNPNPCNLNYVPQFENSPSNNLNSKNSWTEVSGSYTAIGGEKFIVIGNFKDTANSVATYTGWSFNAWLNGAIYYLDDILVSPCDSLTGIDDSFYPKEIKLFPTEANAEINIKSDREFIYRVNIFSAIGQFVYSDNELKRNLLTVDVSSLTKGVYIVAITTNKNKYNFKFIKN